MTHKHPHIIQLQSSVKPQQVVNKFSLRRRRPTQILTLTLSLFSSFNRVMGLSISKGFFFFGVWIWKSTKSQETEQNGDLDAQANSVNATPIFNCLVVDPERGEILERHYYNPTVSLIFFLVASNILKQESGSQSYTEPQNRGKM